MELPAIAVELPAIVVELPATVVELLATVVELPVTAVKLPGTAVALPVMAVALLNGSHGSECSNSKAMTGENFGNKMQQSTMEKCDSSTGFKSPVC